MNLRNQKLPFNNMELVGKVAIVTGASKGLGKAISQALIAKQCKKVFGIGRNQQALNELANVWGSAFQPVILDISNLKDVEDWLNSTFNPNYYPDILINNAGIGSFQKLDEMSSKDWYQMVNTNVNGMYNITSNVLKLMRQHPTSSYILNIGSILGTTTRSEGSAYCATKYALSGFSEALFKEVRGDNVKVTCLNPGSIETDFFQSSGIKAHDNMLHPEELANVVTFLLESPDNMLINELTVRPLNPKDPSKE